MPALSSCAYVAPNGYEKRKGEIALVLSRYHLKHLHFIYTNFDGDIALAITLAEITHHNTCRYFPSGADWGKALKRHVTSDQFFANLEGCNAFSLSLASGIPRETIRRKVRRLSELGWVSVTSRGSITITPKAAEHFLPARNVEVLNDLTGTCDMIRRILNHD
jgi:hypothetical protein